MDYKNNHLIKGVLWSGVDKFGIVLFQLILELFLARLLLPKDYGVVGIVLVFISIAVTFTEGGFSNALIHKQDRNEVDYSAVFYFNIATAIFVYFLIFFSAPFIERFYEIKNLAILLRVTCLSIIFSSSVIVHKTKLSVLMDFKTQAKCSLLAVIVSGILSLVLAYKGYGVWALVFQILSLSFLNSFFLWLAYKWLPQLSFSFSALKRLFGFGSRVLASAVIQSVYFNSYPTAIGKVLSTKTLGIYAKSNQFTLMPSSVLTTVLQRVLFPFFSSHQNDSEKVFRSNQLYTKISCLLFFPIFFTLFAVSYPLIILLFSAKWSEMVGLFGIFCLSYSLYPVIVNNMMMFQVKNKTQLFLNIEIVTKIIGVLILIFTIHKGLIYIGIGIFIQQILQFLITTVIVQRLLQKGIFEQIKIIVPLFLMGLMIGVFTRYLITLLSLNIIFQLLIGILICVSFFVLVYFIFYKKDITYIYNTLKRK
ncbi:lipopolysaccharide biosynthesis protein [Halpernia sp.]|uniref:lipopolysaccharide biosynthesis protein n=1 Tax=Halpernia sp. TaxID=2782209 RepID=UPI003A94989B